MPNKTNNRNAQGSGTIRQRKDGRWEARYTTGRDPGTGKQIQKSVYGNTQADVRKKLAQATAAIDTGTYTEPSRLTVGAWLDIWLAEYNKAVKERTLLVYKGHADYRIKPAIGAKKLSALRPHDIQTFLNQQGEEIGGKKALSPKSVKDVHGVLHKALAQAVLNGYITSNPADFCELPRIQKKEMKPLDSAQITGFLNAIKDHPFETLYTLALFTGLRQGEILGLTWDCLNGETLFVYRQLQLIKGEYKLVPLKNDKMRSITLPPAVI
jgi:integrase